MRIIQTPVRFYPFIGGVESYVYDISRKLVERDHSVTVFCAHTGEGQKRECIDGIYTQRLFSPFSIAHTNVTPSLPIKLLQEARNADIIHTHLPTPWSADLSTLAGRITDTPVVLTYHNDIIGDGFADIAATAYTSTVMQHTLDSVDKILITQPEYLSSSEHLGEYRNKVEVIRNGVDTDKFRPVDVSEQKRRQLGFDPDRANLFFLSVLDEYHDYKGLDVLLEAMERLVESADTPPKLLVGGDGSKLTEYQQQAQDLDLEPHVEFVGRIDEDDLVPTYNAADVFVLPSTSSDQEGFGLVLLEALSCGTQVVTTDVVGVSEEIQEHDLGELVERGNPESLADGIEKALGSGSAERSARGRSLCESHYSWDASVDSLLELYTELK